MPISFSWTPKSVKPSRSSQVLVTLWDGTPVNLASVLSVDADGTVHITVPSTNRYRILVSSALGTEAVYPTIAETFQSDKPVKSVLVVTGSEPRPNDASSVFWIGGSSMPDNMTDADLWFKSGSAAPATDTAAPTVPASVTVSAITSTSFTVSWQASSDNVGVTGYEVSVNGVVKTTTASTSATITGLTASTPYSITIRARDAVGNWSALSGATTATTSAASSTIEHNVYGTSDYPIAIAKATDNPVTVATSFYTISGTPPTWRILGARLFVPAGVSLASAGVFSFWNGNDMADQANPDLSATPTLSATMSNISTGWNEVRFASPFTIPVGKFLWVGYKIGDGTSYLSGPSVTSSFTRSVNTNQLVETEDARPANPRSWYRYDNLSYGTGGSGNHYGIDIIVDEGP